MPTDWILWKLTSCHCCWTAAHLCIVYCELIITPWPCSPTKITLYNCMSSSGKMKHCECHAERLDVGGEIILLSHTGYFLILFASTCLTFFFRICALWGSDIIAIRVDIAQTGSWQKASAKGQHSASSVALSFQYGPLEAHSPESLFCECQLCHPIELCPWVVLLAVAEQSKHLYSLRLVHRNDWMAGPV